jgi:hypothetical protein
MEWFRRISTFVFADKLKHGPVSVPLRMCTSKHLGDYQFLGLFSLAPGGLGIFIIGRWLYQIWSSPSPPDDKDMVTVGLGAFAMAATLASWVYQSANRRIGVVDLFACEISSICRVCLIMDFAKWSVARHGAPAGSDTPVTPSTTPPLTKVSSEENYTPVYDNQLTDLQSLSGPVVNAVTAFYTYRKTMMDCMRSSAAAQEQKEALERFEQSIYMQFLMYESGRHAIKELAEFQPDRAESLVNILCSELTLFAFLYENHQKDFKGDRLRLRLKDYHEDVTALLAAIDSNKDQQIWDRARVTSEQLKLRYSECNSLCDHYPIPALDAKPAVETSPPHMPDPGQTTTAKAA